MKPLAFTIITRTRTGTRLARASQCRAGARGVLTFCSSEPHAGGCVFRFRNISVLKFHILYFSRASFKYVFVINICGRFIGSQGP